MNAHTNSQRFKHFRKWIRSRPDSYFALILVPVLILTGTVAFALIERWSLAEPDTAVQPGQTLIALRLTQ